MRESTALFSSPATEKQAGFRVTTGVGAKRTVSPGVQTLIMSGASSGAHRVRTGGQ